MWKRMRKISMVTKCVFVSKNSSCDKYSLDPTWPLQTLIQQDLEAQLHEVQFHSESWERRGIFLSTWALVTITWEFEIEDHFQDRAYIPFYTVSTHYAGPGYRLDRQDIMPTAPPSPPPLSSSLSLPSRAPVVNYSIYHLIVETPSFRRPCCAKALTLPPRISYGGTAIIKKVKHCRDMLSCL